MFTSHSSTKRLPLAAAASLIGLTLALAACQSGDDDTLSRDPGAPEQATQAQPGSEDPTGEADEEAPVSITPAVVKKLSTDETKAAEQAIGCLYAFNGAKQHSVSDAVANCTQLMTGDLKGQFSSMGAVVPTVPESFDWDEVIGYVGQVTGIEATAVGDGGELGEGAAKNLKMPTFDLILEIEGSETTEVTFMLDLAISRGKDKQPWQVDHFDAYESTDRRETL